MSNEKLQQSQLYLRAREDTRLTICTVISRLRELAKAHSSLALTADVYAHDIILVTYQAEDLEHGRDIIVQAVIEDGWLPHKELRFDNGWYTMAVIFLGEVFALAGFHTFSATPITMVLLLLVFTGITVACIGLLMSVIQNKVFTHPLYKINISDLCWDIAVVSILFGAASLYFIIW